MFDRNLEQEHERSLLDQALTEELPVGAADVPTEILLGGWKRRISQAVSLVVFALLAGGFFYIFGFTFGTFTLLVIAGAVLTGVASGFPDFTALDRALHISGQGVRLEKLHRDQFAPWWGTNRIQAKDDLSAIRFMGASAAISINAGELEDAAKKSIVSAVRAREPYHGIRIEGWPRGGISGSVRRGFGLVGPVLILVAFYFYLPGGTLGMRCSANSAFLQRSFDTPNRQGCVVLRVSAGAEKAGIQRGDLVIEMEGSPVTSGQQFTMLFERSDAPWDFTVIRKGEAHPRQFTVRGGRGENFRENDNDPFFYYLRALWDANDKPEQAIEDYSRAIELEPDFDLAYLYRGELYVFRRDVARGERDYQMALALTPELGEVYADLAYLHAGEDDFTALHEISRAVELHACTGGFEGTNLDCALDYILLAWLQAEHTGLDIGITNARAAIRFFPEAPEPYFQLATFFDELGDHEEAAANATRYLEFDESDRDPEYSAEATRIRDANRSVTPATPAR